MSTAAHVDEQPDARPPDATHVQRIDVQRLARDMAAPGMTSVTSLDSPFPGRKRIDTIVYHGNKRTQQRIMDRELNLIAGDSVTASEIEAARQAIMDLGLFKSVRTELTQDDSGNVLNVTIEEKHYWFILPKLSRSGDGDLSYGIGLKLDNMFGLDHKLEVVARRKDFSDADIDKSETFGIEYEAPRIFESSFDMSLDLRLQESNIDEEPLALSANDSNNIFNRDLDLFKLQVGRWLNNDGVSRGWRISSGMKYLNFKHDFVSGDPDRYFDASSFALLGGLQYYSVRDRLYSREGRHFGFDVEQALTTDGEPRNFSRQGVFWREFKKVTKRDHTNLNLQFRAGYSRNPLFDDPTFSIASSRALRGYERDSVEGNRYAVVNMEFLTPFKQSRPALRGVVFADVGNAWNNPQVDDDVNLRYGAGVGLRWKIRSLVKTEIRIDYAHGFKGGINKFYLGTRATF